MKNISSNVQRAFIATAFASGLLSSGVVASAQTAAPIANTATSATTVSMSTVDAKAQRRAQLEAFSAEVRRVAFRNLGTSL